jgi:glycogen(starch) synthase
VPGGLDTRRFAQLPPPAEARRRLGLDDRHTLVTVRRLVPRMGLELAIDALALVVPELDAQLVVAGTGPELEALQRHVHARGLADRVRFLGRVPDEELPLLYAAGDVCVVPSRQLEGFGYTALEALAAGTPVIAAGTAGLAELVGGLEPRWVVAADPAAIASAAIALATDRAAYPDGEACARHAATMDWANILPRVVAVFEAAIASCDAHARRPR